MTQIAQCGLNHNPIVVLLRPFNKPPVYDNLTRVGGASLPGSSTRAVRSMEGPNTWRKQYLWPFQARGACCRPQAPETRPAKHRLQKVCICWRPSNHACWWRLVGSGRGAEQGHGNHRWTLPDLEAKSQNYINGFGSLPSQQQQAKRESKAKSRRGHAPPEKTC